MAIEPTPGLVIRFDFLWKQEWKAGQEQGSKDRPCVVVIVVSEADKEGAKHVVVCPVTHSPPSDGEAAVEIPPKVARHLQLDDQRSWIKTDAANQFTWEPGRIPFGMTPTPGGDWSYGKIPYGLRSQVLEQVRQNSRAKVLQNVKRDE